MMSDGRVPAATRSMIWAPARSATCRRRESTAGIAALPAGAIPSASVRQAIVDAVPIGEQCPSLRHIPASNSSQSACVNRPARSSSLSRQQSVHAPTFSLRKRPLSIGPPVTIIAGTSTLAAPMRLAGMVLSQLARRTTPSTGLPRISSSTAMAIRFRYSIAVGLMIGSPREITGISTGKPPARSTPRFTCSARSRRCALHPATSLQLLRIPITGRPVNDSSG